jgi:hypothetical protein
MLTCKKAQKHMIDYFFDNVGKHGVKHG